MRSRKFGDKITITFPATSKTCCVALDFVKELPRNPRMLAKARTKIVRRRAVLRGKYAALRMLARKCA